MLDKCLIRKLGDPLAGPALRSALKHELPDKLTWESQYQMRMALRHCGYKKSTPFLHILAYERFEHKMVLAAVGDSCLSHMLSELSRPALSA
jgi:hypothetical protein